MNRFLKLVALAACFTLSVLAADDPRLAILEATLNDAMTQTDMNIASFEISQYLNAELTKAEQQIRAHLTDDHALSLIHI